MNKQHPPTRNNANTGRMWAGIIILGIGALLLAGRLGLDWLLPHWLFSWHNMWPMMLIAIGLVIGGNSNFRNPASYILIGIGSFFFLKNLSFINIGPFLWPVVIIGLGLWLLLGKGRPGPCGSPPGNRGFGPRKRSGGYEWDKRVTDDPESPAPGGANAFSDTAPPMEGQTERVNNMEDFLSSTSIFSDIKKNVVSKNFLGGEVVNVFGGTDINLVQADIHQPVVINVFQLFAGMKIIVPSNWKIQSEVVSVFGEVDDKRFAQGIPQHDDQKTVYIRGTSIFGGITIKNI